MRYRIGGFFISLMMIVTLGYSQVKVTLPDTTANWNSQVTIPVRIANVTAYDIYSYEFIVKFDGLILKPAGVNYANTIASGWPVPIYNDSTKGTIIIGGYGTNKLVGSGRLVNILFDVIGNPNDISDITFTYFQFNDGAPTAFTINGRVKTDTNLILVTTIQSEAILLEWTPLQTTTIYNVYRDTVYNFVPDTLYGTNRIGYNISDEDPNKAGIQWTDTGNGANIVGDVAKNYFYIVTSAVEVESAPSNVAGEFDYELSTTSGTDINEIVIVLDTRDTDLPIVTAEDLAQAIPNCSDVYYWDAAGQGTVGHVKGLPFNNFSVYCGYPYMVNVTAPTIWTTAGSYVDSSFNLITTESTDINHIGLPLEKGKLTTAEMMGQDIPGCTDVYYWDAEGQGTVGHVVGLPFNNFVVRAGYPYYVNVTTATVWPTGDSGLLMKSREIRQSQLPSSAVPHTVFGQLNYDTKDSTQKNMPLTIRAWILGRPGEVLTEARVGTGINGNYWWVGVGNFETGWTVGESLQVEITATEDKLQGRTVIWLSAAGSDNAGTIQLSKMPIKPSLVLDKL